MREKGGREGGDRRKKWKKEGREAAWEREGSRQGGSEGERKRDEGTTAKRKTRRARQTREGAEREMLGMGRKEQGKETGRVGDGKTHAARVEGGRRRGRGRVGWSRKGGRGPGVEMTLVMDERASVHFSFRLRRLHLHLPHCAGNPQSFAPLPHVLYDGGSRPSPLLLQPHVDLVASLAHMRYMVA